MSSPTPDDRVTPGEHGHLTTAERDACPTCTPNAAPSSNEKLFCVIPKEKIGFDVTVEVDEKGEVPRRWIILRDSDPNGPTILDVEDALALRTWLNKVLAQICLCDNYTQLICPVHSPQSAHETPDDLRQCYSRTGLEAFVTKHFPDSRLAPVETRVREIGYAVECDMRVTIASDTDEMVTDCFRAVDDALTAVSEQHPDVVMTVKCVTGSAVETSAQRCHCGRFAFPDGVAAIVDDMARDHCLSIVEESIDFREIAKEAVELAGNAIRNGGCHCYEDHLERLRSQLKASPREDAS